MNEPWRAERRVDADQAVHLIRDQCPDVPAQNVVLFGEGWDNTAYLVDDRWVFRFPRRSIAVPLLEAEIRALPFIAERVEIQVPNPAFVGQPTKAFPWPFYGYAVLPGRTACHALVEGPPSESVARQLGRFLAALHGLPTPTLKGLGAPEDEFERAAPLKLRDKIISLLADAGTTDWAPPDGDWVGLAKELAEDAADTELAVVHGDLYPRHLVVSDRWQITGVIDWGDLHIGAPAIDLSIAYTLFEPSTRKAFLSAYGDPAPARIQLAKLRALHYALNLGTYGHSVQDSALLNVASYTFRQLSI